MEERVSVQSQTLHSEFGEDLRLPLRNMVQGLREVVSQLREGESLWRSEDFDLQFFWKTLGDCFKAISQEATKLSLAFSKPPLPSVQDCQKLTADFQKNILNLTTVYYWLPKSQDNQVAVLSLMSSSAAIVEDALEEMEQARHADNPDPFSDIFDDADSRENRDTYWSETDKQLMAPCLGLVKAAKACLKKVSGAMKTHGKVDSLQHTTQLDDLGDITCEISPSVDELVLSLYPPMNYMTVQMNAAKVASVLNKVLEITKSSHICPESENSWLQFLSGAIEHNMDKVKDLTQGST
ncbi:cyclin-D1-binding protein 1 homolog isoform X2 [Carcharodon carcharias]|uniref:cyclin-D1-binding protein 1 homolog isoform X2 n=1 Tax=Carcharodon carcharias TaxID=13397 RepID=UPI001B7E20D4|nr:cyclin-D1-binding protein 1 homolog isoform X2 [Carcharodon carcharias]